MMRQPLLALSLLVGFAACDAPTELPPTPMDPVVDGTDALDEFIDLARAIRDTPEKAEELLDGAGMTGEAFTARLWEINADPDLSARYAAGMER